MLTAWNGAIKDRTQNQQIIKQTSFTLNQYNMSQEHHAIYERNEITFLFSKM